MLLKEVYFRGREEKNIEKGSPRKNVLKHFF